MARWLAAAGALALVGGMAVAGARPDDKWWRDYAGSADSSRYFPSKGINKKNVGTLTVAWTYPFGETLFNPIVVRGIIYGPGRNGPIVALDARTGQEIWIHEGMQ